MKISDALIEYYERQVDEYYRNEEIEFYEYKKEELNKFLVCSDSQSLYA
ncbi:hypothetical protein SAMN06264849_1156 [Melghirimyces algeriensis]|uniref:Uncharacterized protein n=1 Tax=Melghirimyces algeriensis TaxID=910412 RepID=A0A521F9P1_9BACL|nr:hypothetical protein SAMN06264849_1156 [Melghirimyces algeriensis]